MSRVTDLLKSAVELNLRYTSTLLYLSKDYLKEVNGVIAGNPPSASGGETEAAQQPRPPLLVAGRAGEVAQGAFSVHNPGEREMNVHLLVQGELSDRQVEVEPARISLKPGDSATVRVLAQIDERMAPQRDHLGSVIAPGLTNQAVPFIVRRLPDAAGADPAPPAAAGGADGKPSSGRAPRRRQG